MRFFRAEVATRDENVNVSRSDELGDLFEQVGKRAIVAPEAGRRLAPFWGCDDEEGLKRFPVYVFAMGSRTSAESAEDIVYDACRAWGIGKVERVTAWEASFADDFLNGMDWHDVGASTVLQKGNLFELYDLTRSRRVFKDWKVARRDDAACRAAARETPCSKSLAAEVERMFAARDRSGAGGAPIPVHYLVEGCERSNHGKTLDSLLESLLAAGRLPSEHAFHLNFDNARVNNVRRPGGEKGLRNVVNDSLAFALAGNVIIAQYGLDDHDGSYDGVAYGDFCRFVEAMKPYLDDTLVVFSVPAGSDDLKRRVRRLAGVPLVEVSPDEAPDARSLGRDEALASLDSLARGAGVRADGRLAEMLDECLADPAFRDLGGLFDDWRRERLVSERFPAYGAEMRASLELRGMHDPDAMSLLDDLVGLAEVKRQIKDIMARFRMNQAVARAGLPVQPFSMHLAFLGSPGTGKTEVARLYGQILKEAGVLSEGRIVSVSGSDLCRTSVEAVFDRARGSVLFVDEAYALRGASVTIAELIACMENRREDTVVILAGYEEDMDALLDSNAGFRSRLGFTLHFPEYDADELLQIFELMCRRACLDLPDDARRTARDLLTRNGRRPDQGNARYVRKLFEDSLGAQQVRLARRQESGGGAPSAEELRTLLARDIGEAGDLSRDETPARDELEGLVGLSEVKRLVSERIDFMRAQKLRRDAGLPAGSVPMHMAFLGAPGTGKTEVARLMGRILRDEGALSVGDFYECTGASLNMPIPGASEAQVRALFQKARGSVVFIDEAYSMLQHANGADNEAVSALIAEMENRRDEVVVILAGYKSEIEELLKSNPGFDSRVRAKIEFPDYSPDELTDVFCHMAAKQRLNVCEGSRQKAKGIMERAAKSEGFGNARFARSLLEGALLRQSSRLAVLGGIPSPEQLCEILPEDIEWNPPSQGAPIGFASP